ncbi:tetratricopeptide repeat protein [Bacteroidales bacterium OttesenSCG-928-K03]|nr:tetratricopeptide repeat protein [Odoribacter sp. OttesenSCG-928-L07]MDL2239429.1 tetratricopeptide repeat protein [Bacteroidales bacterium OttesenSCG-928-L14]MDL2242218.1 tetratricopeptide repeat protein [Bacteroidales bacterium OttesenSCG-928-K03]
MTAEEIKKTSVFIDAVAAKITGDTDNAIKLFEQAIKLDQNNDAAYYELSQLYLLKYNTEGAVEAARKAVELNNKNVFYLMNLVSLISTTPANKEELALHKKIIELDPTNIEAVFNYTNALLLTTNYDETLKQLAKLEEVMGINEEISMKIARIYDLQNKKNKAIAEMKRLCDAYPNNTKYISMLAELYLNYGKEKEALECYNKIAEMEPNNPYVHITLSEYYRKSKNDTRAYEELMLGFASPELDAKTKISIFLKYYSYEEIYTTNNREAFELLLTISDTHPEDPVSLAMLSDFYLQNNQIGMAKQGFYKTRELGLSNPSVYLNLIYIESTINNYDSIISLSNKAIELYPLIPEFYYYNGLAKYIEKDYEGAISTLKTGSIMIVDNDLLKADFYMMLGDCYYQLNNKTEAFDNYDKSLALNYDNAYLLNNYSYYLSTSNMSLDKAVEMGKKAVELNSKSSYYLDTYAWALFMRGNYKEAERYLEEALKYDGDDRTVILEHLGDTKWKLNEATKALEYWEKAYESNPDEASDILKKKIKDKTYYFE